MLALYKRPARCRLCRFPASDGGVPVAKLDMDKLTEWCLYGLDTLLHEKGLREAVFCNFCVADARFEADNSNFPRKEKNSRNWWNSITLLDATWNHFYMRDLIRPCAVNIVTLSDEVLNKYLPENDQELVQNSRPSYVRFNRYKPKDCIFCSLQYKSKLILYKHIKNSHKNVEKYRCSACTIYFATQNEWNKHKKHSHFCRFQCFHCEKFFNYKNSLISHIKKYHIGGKKMRVKKIPEEKCNFCDQMLLPRSIQNHLRKYHPEQAFRCTYLGKCDLLFLTEETRQAHFDLEHVGAPFHCNFCPKTFQSKSKLKSHIELEVRKLPFKKEKPFRSLREAENYVLRVPEPKVKCTFCFKSMPKNKLVQHKRYRHNSGKVERCLYCSFVATTYPVANHIRLYHKSVAIKCIKRCATFFLTTEERDRHVQTCRSGMMNLPKMVTYPASEQLTSSVDVKNEDLDSPSDKKYTICTFCLRKFKINCLSLHLRKRHRKQAVRCSNPKCSTYFLTSADMDLHFSQTHKKFKKDIQCRFCDRAYSTKEGFHLHMKKQHLSEVTGQSLRVQMKDRFNGLNAKVASPAAVQMCYKGPLSQNKKFPSVNCFYCLEECNPFYLASHMRQKHEYEAIRCTLKSCVTYFLTLADRDRHVSQFHSRYRREYRCSFCDKIYNEKYPLIQHTKKVHPRVSIFDCKYTKCAAFFYNSFDEEDHYKKIHAHHEKMEMHQCSSCDFKTTHSTYLETHVRRMHSMFSLNCLQCPKRFKSEVSLKMHKAVAHRGKQLCVHCQKVFLVLGPHQRKDVCKKCGLISQCITSHNEHASVCS